MIIKPITIDFETYYDKEYNLTKITMEEYIRNPRFEVIMMGIRMSDGTRGVITGTHEEIKAKLNTIPWHEYAVVAHNCLFDAAIMSWIFNIYPALWLDTLSMANAIHHGKPNSLSALSERYGLAEKGIYVDNMLGRHRTSLTHKEFKKYADYCIRDVDICYDLFSLMSEGYYDIKSADLREKFPKKEIELIDMLIRMFTEPVLRLNKDKLQIHLDNIIQNKEKLLIKTKENKDIFTSNAKFAELLQSLGVVPPTKISKTTNKITFAFAKTDSALKELLEHPDERVQAIVAARIGIKSTLEETRTRRFISIANRNSLFPVPIKYSAAHTHRLGGTDKINLQNLPARSGKVLKTAIEFTPGYIGVDCDSSNIEARMLAWLACQDDLVEDFTNKVDVYCKMASTIYNQIVTKKDERMRFVGKTVVLGCGYQTGALKLQTTLKASTPPIELSIEECKHIVDTYRSVNNMITRLWKQSDKAIQAIYNNEGMWLGKEGVVWVDGKRGIKLPNGLYIQYNQLHQIIDSDTGRTKWVYKNRSGITDIYGGKLVENIVQALARIIVAYQLLKINRRYKVALTVHDSALALVPESDIIPGRAYIEECMRWIPKWAQGCPINCESKIGYNYGDMQ